MKTKNPKPKPEEKLPFLRKLVTPLPKPSKKKR